MAGKKSEIRMELKKKLEESRAENEALTRLIIALHEEEIRCKTLDSTCEKPLKKGNIVHPK